MAILALEKAAARNPAAKVRRIRSRIEEGRRFLLDRECQGGGWNHGANQALGQDMRSYPETTGIALAALRGVQSPKVERGIGVATEFLASCHSADSLNWLRLGLIAHGRLPASYCPPASLARRTVPEASLDMLVAQAETGSALFWS
jgi:hypothetical protein